VQPGATDRLPTLPPVMAMAKMPVAVLVSGSGSNLAALIERSTSEPGFGAEIVVVISDRPSVRALDRAEAAGIPSTVVAWTDFDDRATFTSAVCDVADAHGAGALVLAGFMRILAPEAIARFPNKILNTHPALLPAFPGAHAIRDALDHGVKLSGVTVHFVDEQVDHGPIIAQAAVPVLDGDDEATLLERIQTIEHRLYVDVVDAFAKGKLHIGERKVVWS